MASPDERVQRIGLAKTAMAGEASCCFMIHKIRALNDAAREATKAGADAVEFWMSTRKDADKAWEELTDFDNHQQPGLQSRTDPVKTQRHITHIHTYTYTCTRTRTYTHTLTHIYTHTHTYSYIYTHTCAHTRAHTNPHALIHSHTHIHTLFMIIF